MEIKTYAPVIIPTLNRYEHFKRCLESLEKCTGADKTDVYVALDYPPSEKYVEGWRMIDAYLAVKEKQNGFNSLIVVRRPHNYGVWKESGNLACMINEVLEKYDSYICSEDDNVFSPNAIEYFNKGLEKFENDISVYAICAYDWGQKKPLKEQDTFYKAKKFCAWGVARWKKKSQKYNDEYRYIGNVRRMLLDDEIRKKMHIDSVDRYLRMLKKNQFWGDAAIENYLYLEDKYCIFPKKSLVKNLGNDGSGEHNVVNVNQSINLMYANQEIDTEIDFLYNGEGKIVDFKSNHSLVKMFVKRLLCVIKIVLFVRFGKL